MKNLEVLQFPISDKLLRQVTKRLLAQKQEPRRWDRTQDLELSPHSCLNFQKCPKNPLEKRQLAPHTVLGVVTVCTENEARSLPRSLDEQALKETFFPGKHCYSEAGKGKSWKVFRTGSRKGLPKRPPRARETKPRTDKSESRKRKSFSTSKETISRVKGSHSQEKSALVRLTEG